MLSYKHASSLILVWLLGRRSTRRGVWRSSLFPILLSRLGGDPVQGVRRTLARAFIGEEGKQQLSVCTSILHSWLSGTRLL